MKVVPLLALGVLLTAVAFSGCQGSRATSEQCRKIFNRLVELELKEQGFRDPALSQHKQASLVARYENELAACTGRRIPSDAMECVQRAQNTEELSHRCLR